MSDPRTEHADREAQAWAEVEAALERIPRARWEDDGVLPGWSVKEFVRHVAGWAEGCADTLAQMRQGVFQPEESSSDEETDARNAGYAAEARQMSVDQVWSGLQAARELVRQRWMELPEIDDAAIEWFSGETHEHYREHLPELERFAG